MILVPNEEFNLQRNERNSKADQITQLNKRETDQISPAALSMARSTTYIVKGIGYQSKRSCREADLVEDSQSGEW